jgi:hypothetical protein
VKGVKKNKRNVTFKRVVFKRQNDGEKLWPSSH